MTKQQEIKLFEEKKVRSVWDSETEEWYFSVTDVVTVLTDSVNPTDYIKKMRKRDPELGKGWGQIVTPLSVMTPGGRQRMNCANTEGLFRIIQSIPSPKAEPFKQWMAAVAAERLNQMQDPERSMEQAAQPSALRKPATTSCPTTLKSPMKHSDLLAGEVAFVSSMTIGHCEGHVERWSRF